ncbi:MAG: hypothetical protein H3C48_06080 [Chitinophagaceae bacterium]|nr:hypothetical protein [Chitinophagaceae bacterium]
MKFVLYKYKETPTGRRFLYLRHVEKGKPSFSGRGRDAKRFSLLKALFLSLVFRLDWIDEKFVNRF